jgi:glycine/D-amino acid oxidase-like deaminating enzyme
MSATGSRLARFDAVIIGGGHNGLTCAAYLAVARPLRLRARAPRHLAAPR